MSDWKDHLEALLNPENASASGLDAEARQAAQNILSEASATQEAEALLQVLDVKHPHRSKEKGLQLRPSYLRGHLLLQLERTEEALLTLLPLCEKLEQEKKWPELGTIAYEVFQHEPQVDLARYLAKVAEEAGADTVPEGSLAEALEKFPDEHRLCWLVAECTELEGDADHALGLFTGCLPALIDAKEQEKVEEIFLRLEDCEDAETVQIMLHACVRLLTTKQYELGNGYLEPLLPKVKAKGLADEAWLMFTKLLPKAPPETKLRKYLAKVAPEAIPGVDGVEDLLTRSGLMDSEVKVDVALKRLNNLLEFAPGYRVLHASWGPGRIRVREDDAVIIDFKDKPGHRMSLKIARNALKVIPSDDLRVLWAEDPDKVKEMVRRQRADVAYLAIRELGGKATTQEMRRRLTPEIIKTSSWSTWWKDARTLMEEDERFDFAESFQQTYAIRTPGDRSDQALELPRMDRRRGIRANLNLLKRFLDQHPQHLETAVRMYTPVLTRWMRDERTNAEAAVAVCLTLDGWKRLDVADLDRGLKRLLETGVEASAFADEDSQRLLASRAMELEGSSRDAVYFALGSRYASIREIALQELRGDAEEGRRVLSELLSQPEERPNTALTVILTVISEDTDQEDFFPSAWRAAHSLARLVERTGRDSFREQIMRLFNPNSQLAEKLRKTPVPDDVPFLLEDSLGRWRQSENYLFPILDFFEAVGLEETVGTVRENRSSATNRLLMQQQRASEHTFDGYYLSRGVYQRLEQERNHLATELKTTVAQAIQSARELGDLSENAEYDAAKEKQANYHERIHQIDAQLSRSTLLDNVEVPESVVGPGSYVELKVVDAAADSAGATLHFWLLGEGDSVRSQEVLSCAAPAAQSLLGLKVGETAELRQEDALLRVEVVSTERRLPQTEASAGTP